MINVEMNDILDVVLNIPNAVYTFYFHTKVCSIKNKKAYILILTLYMSFITFLQNTELLGYKLHVVLAFLGCVIGIQLFISEKRFEAFQFTFLIYIALILGEAVFYVAGFAVFHVNVVAVIENIKLMIPLKICFLFFALCIEYVVTLLWLAKAGKIKNNFNKTVLLLAVVELFVVWSTLWITLAERENGNAALVCCISTACMLAFNIVQFMVGEQDIGKQNELVKECILKEQLNNQESRKNELEEYISKANEIKAYILENVGKASDFLEECQGEYAHERLQGIVDTIAVKYMFSNNKIADVLLSDKAKQCEKYGIKLQCRLDFPGKMPIDNARLCIVLSNLLDNAIRACCGLHEAEKTERKPFISLTVNERFGYLVIRQENSFGGIVENRRSGAFSEHGLGLEIIRSIADELGGELTVLQNDKVFVTSIGVPMMKKQMQIITKK